jgi:hypothetical protein
MLLLSCTRCPLVPLKLVLDTPQGGTVEVLALDADGNLRVSLSGPDPVARFDDRGCLTGPDGVWVEQTRSGNLWTQRALIDVAECTLSFPDRTLTILPDGKVQAGDEPLVGLFRFEGYDQRSCCAARILLAAFLSMMPSMAVSDGVAPILPPPGDSVCPERHR